jgi:hypothetical protein
MYYSSRRPVVAAVTDPGSGAAGSDPGAAAR